MRDILFRAKRVSNGEWEYGKIVEFGYTNEPVQYCIVPTYASALYGLPVDPNTVGQYIGVDDNNGDKIFEGDILKLNQSGCVEVVFDDGVFGAWLDGVGMAPLLISLFGEGGIVIGNVYDEEEMSKGK